MAADLFTSMASSRPIRGTVLVLLVLFSFYLVSPLSRPSINAPKSLMDTKASWISWKPNTDETAESGRGRNVSNHDIHEGGPRIRQASMVYASSEYNAVYERAIASHIRHGDRWNVPTHILRHDIVEAGYFNKPAFLLGLVIDEMSKPYGERADWIVWFDADSILFNVDVPWNIFLPPPEFSHVHFLGTKDQNGFNAGMLFVRVHKWTVNMLAQVITIRETHPDVDLWFEDQSAFTWALERPGYAEHAIYQPHNWWNSFGLDGKPFDHDRFVLHFAGVGCCGGEDKAPVMLRWLDQIESDPDHYRKPLSNLTLRAEISEFWDTAILAQKTLREAEEWAKAPEYGGKAIQDARAELMQSLLSTADDISKMKAGITKIDDLRVQADKEQDQQDKA